MKKILLLLLTVLTFTSCVESESYRSDDIFVIISKELRNTEYNTEYKYLYRTQHYMTSVKYDLFYLENCFFVSNENYELGDTIKFIRYASNEK